MWAGRAFLPLAGVVAAAALLAVGCGGDDPAPIEPVPDAGEGQGPAALTKSEFTSQGDAICGEANAALAAPDTGTVGSDPKLQATHELRITRSQLQSLQSLSPPDQDRSVLDRFLAALEDQVDALSSKQAAVEQGDDPSSADAEASSAAASAQAAAQEYGFEECANASSAPDAPVTTTVPTVTTPAAPTVPTTPVPTTPAPPTGGTGGAGGGTGGGTGGGAGPEGAPAAAPGVEAPGAASRPRRARACRALSVRPPARPSPRTGASTRRPPRSARRASRSPRSARAPAPRSAPLS